MKYEIYDQETGERIGKPVSTTRAAQRLVTLIHQKTGLWPDYRGIKNAGAVKSAINTGFDMEQERKINNCKECDHYINACCRAGHNYDGTVKSAINIGFDIECKDYKSGKGAPAASRS